VVEAVVTAGAALDMTAEGRIRDESRPANVHVGTIASYVARSAERAAAAAGETDSMIPAAEACGFAASAAYTAEHDEIMDALTKDFGKLLRAARSGKWTDATPIPLEFWGML
jgi:hypothetical protein